MISPKSELPYARMASIALKMHRPADALPSAQRAVGLGPDSAEAHYLLGRSCLEVGQREKALQELEAASKMAPGSPEVHFNLAKAYAKANLPEKAEQERATFARLNALAELQRSLAMVISRIRDRMTGRIFRFNVRSQLACQRVIKSSVSSQPTRP